jgi:GDP-L-fucose synthase
MNKKILITGGGGFIAKSLYEHLRLEHTVLIEGRDELNLLDSSGTLKYIKDGQFDVVIHTANHDAAPRFSTKDPNLVLENNLKMFFNIVRCEDYFGKMIYYGSGAEFGRQNWIPKMKETYFDENVPQDQYGLAKYAMTKHALLSNNIYNLRLFGVFGEHDDWRYRFISNACCKAVLDMPITFRKNVFFDFLYIQDLVKITKWFIDNKSSEKVYNICSGQTHDYQSLAKRIVNISSKNLEVKSLFDGLGDEYSGDNSLLLSEIQDFEFTPINDAIKSMYEWYNSNKQIIKKELFEY